jgi:serine/threonine-protein kinase HSL1, negative regulator of Swe1 kinase
MGVTYTPTSYIYSLSTAILIYQSSAGQLPGSPGIRPVPCGIEQEVVIMKLIEHPNVISLHDVWENRGELWVNDAQH